jgi:acetolactate synthase I/II/III large subunit
MLAVEAARSLNSSNGIIPLEESCPCSKPEEIGDEIMNTAQVLVELLKEYGVEYVFGVPGDTSMALYDALHAARGEITHIMARDERSAAFMADAYARLAYKPGVTEAPSGGGATYVVPGVAEANGSSVPMIVFTSDVPITDEGKGTLTAIDQQRLLEGATKWSAVVKRPQMLPDIVRKAFRAATSGRGGAVHVVLPEDVLHEEAPPRAYTLSRPADAILPIARKLLATRSKRCSAPC